MESLRYFVRPISGGQAHSVLFGVFDGQLGIRIGESFFWKDEADKVAARLNSSVKHA